MRGDENVALSSTAIDQVTATPFRSPGAEGNGFAPREGFVPFTLPEAETTLAAKFQRIAATHRGSIAVVDEAGTSLTYGELFRNATILAGRLSTRVSYDVLQPVIIIAVPPGLSAIELIFASLLAGCAYLPIDLSWPDAQIGKLLKASIPEVIVVADEKSVEQFQRFAPKFADRVVGMERISTTHPAPQGRSSPGNIAAIFATSGSTGDPKLVALSHRAILFDIGRQVNDLFLGPDDRFDLLFSLGFSASLAPLFAALLVGAQLHLFGSSSGLPQLPEWLERRDISITTMSVSTFRSVFLAPRRVFQPGNLRLVSVGGEALLASDVQAYRQCFPPECVLQNAMAATETRTYAQFFVPRFGAVNAPVPIGWPVYGKEVVLLDEQGGPAAEGQAGEIAVRSAYLSSGYLNDDELTKRKFRRCEDGPIIYKTGDRGRWQQDGSLAYLGRADLLVKIRGYRVELTAIEAAILRFGVGGCAVAAREEVPGDLKLIAYVVARQGQAIRIRELRDFLAKELPDYMVPAQFVPVDVLPTNANGKLDRKSLPAPPQASAGEEADEEASGESSMETELRSIWSQVLGVDRFSREASFVELGGDSLKAVRAQLMMRERLGRLGTLYFHPRASLTDVLAALRQKEPSPQETSSSLVPFVKHGMRSSIFFIPGFYGNVQKGREIADYGAGHPVYAIDLLNDAAQASIVPVEAIAAENLRQIRGAVRRSTPLILIGFSFGAMIAFEMARQLTAAGEPMPLLFIGDMPAVNSSTWRKRNVWKMAIIAAFNLPGWINRAVSRPDARRFLGNAVLRFGLRFKRRFKRMLSTGAVNAEQAAQADLILLASKAALPESFLRAFRNNQASLARYVPQSYAGDMVLLRASAGSLFADREPTMGWKSVVGGKIDVEWVPGEHSTCFDEPNLAATMEVIQRHIDQFEYLSQPARQVQSSLERSETRDDLKACVW